MSAEACVLLAFLGYQLWWNSMMHKRVSVVYDFSYAMGKETGVFEKFLKSDDQIVTGQITSFANDYKEDDAS